MHADLSNPSIDDELQRRHGRRRAEDVMAGGGGLADQGGEGDHSQRHAPSRHCRPAGRLLCDP